MQCRLEIILTLPSAPEAHTDIFFHRENNHCAGIKHKSSHSRWVFCSTDRVREREAVLKDRSSEEGLHKLEQDVDAVPGSV